MTTAIEQAPDRLPSTGAALPRAFDPARLLRRAAVVVGALGALLLIAMLAPGLDEVRHRLEHADAWWLALAVVLEVASSASYVLMFRPVFCDRMPWRTAAQLGLSELAVGSIVPASGAGGLALGAWVLRRRGMPAGRIARRSVAFFLIKSSVNFVAVAAIGAAMAIGLLGPNESPLLTIVPAAGAALVIALVLLVPRLGPGERPGPHAGRTRRSLSAVRRSLVGGTGEAVELVRSRNLTLLVGAFGYWAFDNAVLLATFHALGDAPPLSVVLLGYLIGQLGGALPLPGGIGGIDGGLIGVLVLFGSPVALTIAAVLAYRLILFWVPLVLGAPAFVALWRRMSATPAPAPA
jgi:uncharacterized membrane protein YbhN (UPF0104 family)